MKRAAPIGTAPSLVKGTYVRSLVGVLQRYSNHEEKIHTLVKLSALPQRRGSQIVTERPRVARRPTPDEVEVIAAAYESGLTLRELGALFGFDRGTISSVVRRAGRSTRYHQRVEVDLDQAERLRAQGMTITEVAERLGVGRTTLVRARREGR